MARMSNLDKAIAYAAERGITITTDHNDRGGIIRISLSHSGNTVPQLWATIIRELETIPTEDTCHTYTERPILPPLTGTPLAFSDKCPACGDVQRPCECGLL